MRQILWEIYIAILRMKDGIVCLFDLYASFIDFQNICQNDNISTRIDLVETLND